MNTLDQWNDRMVREEINRTPSHKPENLDHALYSASCYAGNCKERVVTIMVSVQGRNEHYKIVDDRVGPHRDNTTGWDWEPVYYIEAAR